MAELTYEGGTLEAEKAKTMQETDKKCPQCGGVMDFDPSTGGMHCPYCDYKEEIAAANASGEEKAAELDFDKAEFTENCDWGVEQKTVTCKSCGATTVYDALAVANECPYCGSNQVMEASDVKTIAPNGVVPFKITTKDAKARFTKWLSGKWFAPRPAKSNVETDAFKGVYLPYWTFDADTVSQYTGEYGKDRKVKQGDKESTVTDWYKTSGVYRKSIDDELICASGSQNLDNLRRIEPFDTADNKAYKPEYLAGFTAERYALGLKKAWEKAKEIIKQKISNDIDEKITNENRAQHTRNVRFTTKYSNITYKYLLLPVWISAYQYNGKTYQVMVNGQSGRVGGTYPVSPIRVAIAILIVVAIIGLICYVMN